MNKVYIYIFAHISTYEGKQEGAERRKGSELIIL